MPPVSADVPPDEDAQGRIEPDDVVGRSNKHVGPSQKATFCDSAGLLQDPREHGIPFGNRPQGPAFVHEGQRIEAVMRHMQFGRQTTSEGGLPGTRNADDVESHNASVGSALLGSLPGQGTLVCLSVRGCTLDRTDQGTPGRRGASTTGSGACHTASTLF